MSTTPGPWTEEDELRADLEVVSLKNAELVRQRADLLAALERVREIADDLEQYGVAVAGTDEEGIANETAARLFAAIASVKEGS